MFSGLMILIAIVATSAVLSIENISAHPHIDAISVDSHSHEPITELQPISATTALEKTTIMMHASKDNTLPWGFVEGKIANHVPAHPVIIQIYDENGEAFHFAQADVNEDGAYEYKFRVRNVDDNGNIINIFEGDYKVNIFKVVYLYPDSIQA